MAQSLPTMRHTLHITLIHLMHPADTEKARSSNELVVSFDPSIQSLKALQAAAYRMIATAACKIDLIDGKFVCRLISNDSAPHSIISNDDLEMRFLNAVTDENLRERLAEKTEGVRNVIIALAFGALAASQEQTIPASRMQN